MVLVEDHLLLGEIRLAEFVVERREEVRSFPAVDRAEHGAERLHAVVAGRLAKRAGRSPLLVRIVGREDLGIGFLVLLDEVALAGVAAEATRVDAHHVDGGLAVHDPLGELPPRATGRRDAERVPFVEPEVRNARGGAHDG